MYEMTGHALSVFMGFFAIMNPVANTPVFLGRSAVPGAIRYELIRTNQSGGRVQSTGANRRMMLAASRCGKLR